MFSSNLLDPAMGRTECACDAIQLAKVKVNSKTTCDRPIGDQSLSLCAPGSTVQTVLY
jgi:hypothetical protein